MLQAAPLRAQNTPHDIVSSCFSTFAVLPSATQTSAAADQSFPQIALTEANVSDAKSIESFIREVRSSMSVDPELSAEGVPLYTDLQNFGANFDGLHSRFFVLKDHNGKIVATASYIDKGQRVAELKRFYLDPSLQGKGVGKKLLLSVLSLATQNGYSSMTLQTDARMTAAIALYLKVGFHEIPTPLTSNAQARYFLKPL